MTRKKLLIIDDDLEMCAEISEILRDEGYEVDAVYDGVQGRDRLMQVPYDLVLLDLKIPGMNGFDVLVSIREQRIGVKVLVLSGRPLVKDMNGQPGVRDEEEAILRKADCVMSKPYDIVRVLSTIQELLAV